MTVQDLIDHLSLLPADLPVILASDEEGNSFHPLTEIGRYYADNYPDFVYSDEDFEGEEIPDYLSPVLVLWP
jgi:hypothetical protein